MNFKRVFSVVAIGVALVSFTALASNQGVFRGGCGPLLSPWAAYITEFEQRYFDSIDRQEDSYLSDQATLGAEILARKLIAFKHQKGSFFHRPLLEVLEANLVIPVLVDFPRRGEAMPMTGANPKPRVVYDLKELRRYLSKKTVLDGKKSVFVYNEGGRFSSEESVLYLTGQDLITVLNGKKLGQASIEIPAYYFKNETLQSDNTSPACFPAGTKISTPNGHRNIEELRVGDKVLSYLEHTSGAIVESTVVRTFTSENQDLWELELVDGSRVQATAEHPFYAFNRGGYTPLKDLRSGDQLLNHHASQSLPSMPVVRVRPIGKKAKVYNIQVEGEGGKDTSNYFSNDILVHNKGKTSS